MTREDAISIMKVIVHMLEEKYDTDRVEDAVDMAIKALEQEPNIDMHSEEIKILQKRSYLEGFHEALKMSVKQETCEDCISRTEAQKHIYRRLWESALNNVGYECKAEDVFMDIADNRLSTWISEIPSIQPKTDVLDKIRAEITAISINGQVDEHTMFVRSAEQVKQMALDAIDKYKAESEDKE